MFSTNSLEAAGSLRRCCRSVTRDRVRSRGVTDCVNDEMTVPGLKTLVPFPTFDTEWCLTAPAQESEPSCWFSAAVPKITEKCGAVDRPLTWRPHKQVNSQTARAWKKEACKLPDEKRSFSAVPISLALANRFVEAIHRHNSTLPAARFSIGAIDKTTGEVHGVAIAGLPKARLLDDGHTLEINRVCTDGTYNCCSFLYGACVRAAKALGYQSVITYTQADEPGTSLKASGWIHEGQYGGGSWLRKNPKRLSKSGTPESEARRGTSVKQRWRIILREDRLPKPVWPTWLGRDDQLELWEVNAR